MTDQPELHLLPGELAFDLDALVAFYTEVTGRAPTPEELAEARALIEQSVPRD